MADRLKKQSGHDVLKILVNKFGFTPRKTKSSHVMLIKYIDDKKIGTVVPLHKELKFSMLKEILKQAKISEDEFAQYQ